MKFRTSETNIWFTADTHYGHTNIVKGTSSWEDKSGCRDFSSVEKMNNAIVDGINSYVKPEDILFHLGDWSFGGKSNIGKLRERLAVNVIYLIAGNHDTHILNYDEYNELFTHVYPYREITIDKNSMTLCHFPICSWNRAYRGAWMLHGHTHDTLFKSRDENHWYNRSKIMDVGMDTAYELYGEYKPFSFEQIRQIMSLRQFISIDQHDEKTQG